MDVELGESSGGDVRDAASTRKKMMLLPEIEVRFEDLTVEAEVRTAAQMSLPTLLNYTIDVAKELMGLFRLTSDREGTIRILDAVKGVIRPSRMTLVLGPPGSGKSTLLQALAGKLNSSLKMRGTVEYNGKKRPPTSPQQMCAYVSQHDDHHAEMTVRETLRFAEHMLGGAHAFELMKKLARDEEGTATGSNENDCAFLEVAGSEEDETISMTDYILEKLHLDECADTIIGDEMRRGISGGQKKRVTLGEMLVGFSRCYFMDEISTGLDSTTTYEIIDFLRQMTHSLKCTMAMSLLQPSQEVFDMFDDVILLYDGKIAYEGPRDRVLAFFEHVGFKCPERKNTADFLQEVFSRMDQRQYWTGSQHQYNYITIEQFVASFRSFPLGKLPEKEHYSKCNQSGSGSYLLPNNKDRITKSGIFKACFSRELLLLKRNLLVHIFKNIQIALLAFVIMTVFIRTKMGHQTISDGNHYMGAIFVGVVLVKFNGMTELAMTIRRLPVFYKQRDLLNLPSWALLSSVILLSLPMSVLETGIWSLLTYYTIGFAPSVLRFFQQFLAYFCIHQMSMGLFRFIATIGRTQVMANILGSACLIAIYILGGFVISKDNIQPWLLWGYWASPLTYGQNAVAVNEFLDDRWNTKIQYGNITETVGKAVLRSRGMFTEEHWFWICLGMLVGFSLFFNISSLIALVHLYTPRIYRAQQFNRSKEHFKILGSTEKVTDEKASTSGSLLPLQPLTLAFSKINYYVDTSREIKNHGVAQKRLQLLRDVSGTFRPGILTALMGVTGAGKTTLLDVLAGRKTGGHIEGSITVSGYPKKQETFARISGYCEQNDIHSPFVTVYESLQYSAWLRLPSNFGVYNMNKFVEDVMDLVELNPLKNAMVGIPGLNGLSAEQRKRLTIAVELVSSPSIIFMDEPTTGLDAKAAAIVMRTVRKAVDTGRTIVCTIHQPSIDIFEAFDELLLMKIGGQLIYAGPLGHLSRNMIQYFQAVPGVPRIKNGQNPAEWMLNVTSTSMELRLGIDYAQVYNNSSLSSENNRLVNEMSKKKSSSKDLHFPTKYEQNFTYQVYACLWKQNMSYWKNPEQNVIRFFITIVTSFLFGAVFWKIGAAIKLEQDIFNVLGIMYGSALFLGFTNASIIQPIVAMERSVFYRERSAGMYTSMAYALAQVAVEIPYIILQVAVFSSIVYPMIGFPFTPSKFMWFMLFMLLSFIYFTLFGMMTVALTPNQEIAALFSFFLFVLWNIFSGFFIPRKMIPIWWRWFYWIDPASWTVYGLMASQLGDRIEVVDIPGMPDKSVKEFLDDYLGIQENFLPVVVMVHIIFIVLFLFVFSFSIKHINFQRK